MARVSMVEVEFREDMEIDLVVDQPPLEGEYTSRINTIQDELLEIPVPMVDDLFVPIKPDHEVEIRYYRDEALFTFKASIQRRSELISSPSLFVFEPDRVRRVQKRQHFRVECDLPCTVRVIGSPGDRSFSDPIEARVRDLSAGGLEFHTETEIPEGSRVQFVLELPLIGVTLDDLFAEVVRTIEDEEGNFKHGVTFSGLTSSQEDDLVKYGFRLQSEQHRESLDK